jgi:hypothetical protein
VSKKAEEAADAYVSGDGEPADDAAHVGDQAEYDALLAAIAGGTHNGRPVISVLQQRDGSGSGLVAVHLGYGDADVYDRDEDGRVLWPDGASGGVSFLFGPQVTLKPLGG